tara:strand:- start:155 stop:421 length:267 start_codon:yes stop_codon:yes gene_type:complete
MLTLNKIIMEKLKPKKLELLKEKLQNDLTEIITVNHLIGTETITIGEFLNSGIVSEKIKNEMPDYHEDYLVHPTLKALMDMVNSESKE